MTFSSIAADDDLLWPRYSSPEDLIDIERVPLEERGLPATTFALLQRAARLWPDRTAITVMPDAGQWRGAVDRTYAELASEAAQVANVLASFGVGPTTPVGIVSANCLQLIPTLLGIQAAGIAVPLNGNLGADHLRELIERSGVEILVAASPDLDENSYRKVVEVARPAGVARVLVVEPTAPASRVELEAVANLEVSYLSDEMAHTPTEFADPHQADDLAAIFHTGGTTGIPKLAAQTHSNQVVDAWAIAADSSLDPAKPILAALPLFHVNALHVTVLAPLLRGQRVVWAGPLGFRDLNLYAEIWRIIEHHGIAAISAVPTVYAMLAGCPVDADISSLDFAVVGASALPVSVRTAFEVHTGVPLLEGYGLTEATCASTRNFVENNRPGSVGVRLPYQQTKVVSEGSDGSWTDLPEGKVGKLLIAGPTVFAGYVVGRSDGGYLVDSLDKVRDGWLDTGDLARIEDDFIYLTGRAKDLIIRGGHNIDPTSIESALLHHPDVIDAAAVGMPDARAGEVPVAYVVVAGGSQVSAEQIQKWVVQTGLEQAAVPKRVTILDALPVTDVGKPYKVELRAHAAAVAVSAVLESTPGVVGVQARIVDGGITVSIRLDATANENDITHEVGRLPVAYEVIRTSGS